MSNTATILTEITNHMKDNDLILSNLAREVDMNPGTMSSIINGNRTFSVDQLDRITKAMGHPVGYYYERYVHEYLAEANPNWRRMSPFLHNCARLNKLDCIHEVVNLLMDKLGYSESLFELAEELFKEELYEAAAILYENVAVSEKKQYSERLAMCQYRLFVARQGDNQEENYDAVVQFQTYVERLDEADQLDALRDLVNTCRSLRKWDKANKFATTLGNKAEIQYKIDQQHHAKSEHRKKSFYPPFVYWAFSHLIRAEVCDAKKDYETGLQHIQKYADLSWVEEEDETTLKWKNQFKEWANANTYVNRLLAGEVNVLPDYIAYFSSRKDEVLPALDIIVEAANQYHFDVDDILKQFEVDISSDLEEQSIESFYTQRFITERFIHFSKELSVYYLTKGRFSDGFRFLLSCLEKSTLINNKSYIIKCMRLFEFFQEHASSETRAVFRNLINEVDEDET
ncbi:transcriptional regulator [Paenibacillus maysiensis]|uniref:transcriptional regulator n=1 Tax=Paenibacillus maysiensis TaxID=1155954 RepID=UPI0004720CDF|nr:transcriptional regulator [Paenibacillus maysiensis]